MRRVSDSEGVYQKEVGDGGEGALGPQAFSYSEFLKYSPQSLLLKFWRFPAEEAI